jgi:hypothetical protein
LISKMRTAAIRTNFVRCPAIPDRNLDQFNSVRPLFPKLPSFLPSQPRKSNLVSANAARKAQSGMD